MALVELDLNPGPRTLRNFGLIGLAAFSLFAVMAYFQFLIFNLLPNGAVRPVVYVLAALALYCGLCAPLASGALRPLYVGLSVAFYPVGLVVSLLIMGIIFYLVFTPVALFFKLIGRDTMNRRFEPEMATYWIERTPPATMKRYFSQF